MKSPFRKFLSMLLAISLTATPVTMVLADTAAEAGMTMHHAMVSGPQQASAEQPGDVGDNTAASVPEPCSGCADGCFCPDNTGCHFVTVSVLPAIPANPAALPRMVRDPLIVAVQGSYASLGFSPESPPPIV